MTIKLTDGKQRFGSWIRALADSAEGLWCEDVLDYSGADDASAEVIRTLEIALRQKHLKHTFNPRARPVPSFATLAGGFCIALAAVPHKRRWLPHTMVFHNVAPRKGVKAGTKHGEKFYVGLVGNGDWGQTLVAGVNAGYNWSFLKEHLTALAWVDLDDTGFQFRSADLYPYWVADVLAGEFAALRFFESVDEAEILDVPELCVARIDSFGNAKLTVDADQFPYADGQRLRIQANGHHGTFEATVQRTINFAAGENNISCGAGSSHFVGPKKSRRMMELFLVGGNIAEAHALASGTHLQIERIDGVGAQATTTATRHSAVSAT